MSNLKQVLEELYAIDPSLRDRETELVPLLNTLMRNRPDADIDDAFVARLRAKLASMPVQRVVWFKPWMLALPAFAIALAVIVPSLLPNGNNESKDDGLNISMLSGSAFGELTGGTNTAAPLGSEAARSSLSSIAPLAASGMGGGIATDSKMIAPGEPYPVSTIYQYVYSGTLDDLAANGTVYRKTMGLRIPDSLAEALSTDLGGIDLSGLNGLEAQYLTVRNDQYSISVDPIYGTVFINDNNGYSSSGSPLTASDLPAAESIADAARSFVEKFGVDLSAYGDPTIDQTVMLALAGESTDGYIPEYATVTWPLKINGMSVYNSDGSGYGLSVTVNLRTKEGISASVNAISAAEASSYALETDATALLDIVEDGGLYSWQAETAEKTVTVTLGEPSIVLMPHSTWNESTGRSDELFVPAISFPITDDGGATLYRSAVVVPLVESILEEATNQPPVHILEDGAATSEPTVR